MRARRALPLPAVLLLLAGCGSPVDPAGTGRSGDVRVAAETSLKRAFTSYGETFTGGEVQLSFAAPRALAAQVRSGTKPDVVASADTRLPARLHAEGLVEAPRTFTSNRLVVAVPKNSSKVRSLADLAAPGVKVAIGSAGSPLGSYTRTVLARVDGSQRRRILANVRSEGSDSAAIAAKVRRGAVDAGIVYVTDVVATDGRLRAIGVARRLEPRVAYAVAVVKDARNPEPARAFIDGLFEGAGADALDAAGFRSAGR
jgi:molybdate transport system substrate-binding protein